MIFRMNHIRRTTLERIYNCWKKLVKENSLPVKRTMFDQWNHFDLLQCSKRGIESNRMKRYERQAKKYSRLICICLDPGCSEEVQSTRTNHRSIGVSRCKTSSYHSILWIDYSYWSEYDDRELIEGDFVRDMDGLFRSWNMPHGNHCIIV